MRGAPFPIRVYVGFPTPKKAFVVGLDCAGVAESVGKGETRFLAGDEMYGECRRSCAEYAVARVSRRSHKPLNLTFEQAAAMPTSALAAPHGPRDHGKVWPGQRVLINGAWGRGNPCDADRQGPRGGGDRRVQHGERGHGRIDRSGPPRRLHQGRLHPGEQRFDLILDNAASHSFADCRRVLAPGGTLMPNSGHAGMGYVFTAFLLPPFVRPQQRSYVSTANQDDLVALEVLVETGRVTPVIDRTYPLSETAEAFRYLDEGHARGKVVITGKSGA